MKTANRKPQVWQGRHQEFCYQELEPYAEDIGTRPPVPQTLAVPAGPSPGEAQPTWPYPDTPGCCLLWPQPHVLTLCWVRSVTAPMGTCRVPALHPQLAVGPALAPEPSSLPFPQDAGRRKAPLEPAQGRDLQLASLHCRKTWRGGRDPPAKSPGDPLEAGGICPAALHPGCSSPTAPQRAPRILSLSGGSRRAEGRAEISHGKDGCSREKGGLTDYGQEPVKARDQFSPPWGEESGASAPQELICFLMRSWEFCCQQPATRLPSTAGMQHWVGTLG